VFSSLAEGRRRRSIILPSVKTSYASRCVMDRRTFPASSGGCSSTGRLMDTWIFFLFVAIAGKYLRYAYSLDAAICTPRCVACPFAILSVPFPFTKGEDNLVASRIERVVLLFFFFSLREVQDERNLKISRRYFLTYTRFAALYTINSDNVIHEHSTRAQDSASNFNADYFEALHTCLWFMPRIMPW